MDFLRVGNKANLCCFHPILVTWFLVVFNDEVTNISCNSSFMFHFVLPVLPCKWKTSYRKSRNSKVTKKPKMKLPKYVMSQALLRYMRHRSSLGRATNIAVHILDGTPMFRQTDFPGFFVFLIDSFEAKGF